MKRTLKEYGISPRKKLSQNFIFDINLARKIVNQAGTLNKGTVIEIGSGVGTLTEAILLKDTKEVIAIEYDKACVNALRDLSSFYNSRLRIINEDVLKVDFSKIGAHPRIVISNLPYNISTVLLMKLLEKADLFESFILVFQKEVAERICASPNSKSYGRLSVMAQYRAQVKNLFNLKPEVFTPKPKVDSTVMKVVPYVNDLYKECGWHELSVVTRVAFNQRRKMLRSSLRSLCKNSEGLLDLAGIPYTKRAENLNVSQFCLLARLWKKHRDYLH